MVIDLPDMPVFNRLIKECPDDVDFFDLYFNRKPNGDIISVRDDAPEDFKQERLMMKRYLGIEDD